MRRPLQFDQSRKVGYMLAEPVIKGICGDEVRIGRQLFACFKFADITCLKHDEVFEYFGKISEYKIYRFGIGTIKKNDVNLFQILSPSCRA